MPVFVFFFFFEEEAEEGNQTTSYTKLKDLPKATKELFSHLPFVFITLGVCLEHFYISAAGGFTQRLLKSSFIYQLGNQLFCMAR